MRPCLWPCLQDVSVHVMLRITYQLPVDPQALVQSQGQAQGACSSILVSTMASLPELLRSPRAQVLRCDVICCAVM